MNSKKDIHNTHLACEKIGVKCLILPPLLQTSKFAQTAKTEQIYIPCFTGLIH